MRSQYWKNSRVCPTITTRRLTKKSFPTAQETLGGRFPVLRKIAARIAKNSPDEFLCMDKEIISKLKR